MTASHTPFPREWGRREACCFIARPERLRELGLSHYGDGPTLPRIIRELLLRLSAGDRLAILIQCLPGRSDFWQRVSDDVLYWAGAREALDDDVWQRLRAGGVPVLLYHRVVPHPDRRDPKYALPLAAFDAQMRLLARLGYRSLRLDELLRIHRSGEPPPPKRVVITFDDGYQDNLAAVRSMKRHGFTGAIFLVTGEIGGHARWRFDQLGRVPMLSWGEVERLARDGIEFGAHSVTHPNLTALSKAEAQQEIEDAHWALRRALGAADYCFAYPHGLATAETKELVARAGHIAAFGTTRGLSTMHDDVMYLRRIQIYGDEQLPTFLLRLWLGDNPLDYLPWGRSGRRMQARLCGTR
jgi:peptidoglycan/xylan/chitin deacetylase (PgdA/CDA1 family)